MEKLEFLREMMAQMQITPQDAIKDFVSNKLVTSEFLTEMTNKAKSFSDVTLIPSKKFETPKLILPGMFDYADGLISTEFIPEAPLRSIVSVVDGTRILGWCLRERSLPWSSDYLEVSASMDRALYGEEATAMILSAAKRNRKRAEAAEYCAEYAFDGVESGSAFMASYRDNKAMFLNMESIKHAGKQCGMLIREYYWSSSEYSALSAWILRPCVGASTGGLDTYYGKYDYYSVRPMFLLKH